MWWAAPRTRPWCSSPSYSSTLGPRCRWPARPADCCAPSVCCFVLQLQLISTQHSEQRSSQLLSPTPRPPAPLAVLHSRCTCACMQHLEVLCIYFWSRCCRCCCKRRMPLGSATKTAFHSGVAAHTSHTRAPSTALTTALEPAMIPHRVHLGTPLVLWGVGCMASGPGGAGGPEQVPPTPPHPGSGPGCVPAVAAWAAPSVQLQLLVLLLVCCQHRGERRKSIPPPYHHTTALATPPMPPGGIICRAPAHHPISTSLPHKCSPP